MDSQWQDFRFALRSLSRDRSFTTMAILTLGLGIAAAVTSFAVTKSILLDPLPYPDPDRLVMVWERTSGGNERNFTSLYNYLRWRERNQVFEQIAAVTGAPMNITGLGPAQQVEGLAVSAGFFEALAVPPLLGRTLRPEDEGAPPSPAVVLGYAFWQQHYGGALDVIGRTLGVNGAPREIVGVMPAGFVFPRAPNAQLYMPMLIDPTAPPGGRSFITLARLKPGVQLESARADMRRIVADLIREGTPNLPEGWSASVFPLLDEAVGPVRRILWVIFGAVACLLLLACANVANLMLMRATKRAPELAVRVTLGAGRWRLVQQLAIESLVLTLGAAVLGLGAAAIVAPAIPALFPPTFPLPRAAEIAIDRGVIGSSIAAAILIGLLFNLLPVLRTLLSGRLADTLRAAARTTVSAHARVRRAIVMVEVAIALVLVLTAALMGRSLSALSSVDAGFRPEQVLTVRMLMNPTRYGGPANRERAAGFLDRVVEEVRSTPGVRSAASVHFLPLSGIGSGGPVARADRPLPPYAEMPGASVSLVTDGYFQTMRIPLLYGRDFTGADRRGTPTVGIVNQALSTRLFPGENPVGRSIFVGYSPATERVEIVGVVGDTRTSSLDRAAGPAVYLPNAQEPSLFASLVVRTDAAPESMAAAVRAAIARVDPEQGVAQVAPMEVVVAQAIARPRVQAGVFAVFGGLALIIAAVGLYGVMAYAVEQRRREIGLQLALGAGPQRLLRSIVREGLVLAAIGAVGGAALAWLAGGVLEGLLYETRATDPAILAAVATTLISVAGVAALGPALRATRIDPLVVLRDE